MIEIHPVREKEKLEPLYRAAGLVCNENSIAIVAADGEKTLGNCLFDINEEALLIRSIEPTDDVLFADGLLRSALYVGTENGKMTAFYADTAPEALFKTLGFIKNAEKKELNVDKLFSSCQNCGND